MEYGENDDAPDGVTKWPFYLSALFILALVLGSPIFTCRKTIRSISGRSPPASRLPSHPFSFSSLMLDRFLYLVSIPPTGRTRSFTARLTSISKNARRLKLGRRVDKVLRGRQDLSEPSPRERTRIPASTSWPTIWRNHMNSSKN